VHQIDRRLTGIPTGARRRAIMHGWGDTIMLMTTRRAAIGGAVSAVAVTPVLTGPPRANTVDADAELVQLGAEFEPLFAEWLENERLCREHIAVFEAAVERVTGVPSR